MVFFQIPSAAVPMFLPSYEMVYIRKIGKGFTWQCTLNVSTFEIHEIKFQNVLTCWCTDQGSVLGHHPADLPSSQTIGEGNGKRAHDTFFTSCGQIQPQIVHSRQRLPCFIWLC